MTKPANPSAHSTASPARPARRKPKATAAARRSRPVQLTIFDYAAAIGITLLPEGA